MVSNVTDPDDMATRSKKLAKDLLDGMDAPDDPDRIAYDEQKRIADKQALEDFYVRTGQKKPSAAGSAAKKLADRVASLTEGTFEPIDEAVSAHVALRFAPQPSDPKAERYVQVRVTTPSGGSVSSQSLGRGTTAELVAKLRSPAVAAEIEETAEKLVDSQRGQQLP